MATGRTLLSKRLGAVVSLAVVALFTIVSCTNGTEEPLASNRGLLDADEQTVRPDTARWRKAYEVLMQSEFMFEEARCFIKPPEKPPSEFQCGVVYAGTLAPPSAVVDRLADLLDARVLRIDSQHVSILKFAVPPQTEKAALRVAYADTAVILVDLNHYGTVSGP